MAGRSSSCRTCAIRLGTEGLARTPNAECRIADWRFAAQERFGCLGWAGDPSCPANGIQANSAAARDRACDSSGCLVFPRARGAFRESLAGTRRAPSLAAVLGGHSCSRGIHASRCPEVSFPQGCRLPWLGWGCWPSSFPPPIDNDARTVARTNWTEVSSDFWQVRFETDCFSTEERWQWLVDAGSRLGTYRERLGIELEDGPIRVRVARSEHAMREIAGGRGSAESFVLESLDEPVVMAGSNSQPEDLRSEPLLLMRRAWGQPSSTAMAFALARFALGSFDGDPLLTAAVRVACEESRFEPETVFALDGEYRSPLVRDVLGGAWVESAVARHGTGILPALYSEPVVDSLALCIDCLPACDPSLAHARPLRQRPGYLKGISFSHEVGTGAGYGTAAAVRELGRIADLGANAVAIVPYAFTAAPDEASIRFRTLETDARLLRTVRQARAAGLEIMLKPHLWAGRRFHGSIAFDSEERFDEWFDDYRRWMLHFARFAEMYELDALAVGNELAGLTVHEEDWRSLIAEVRRVYRGPLTYAAHWEEELERIRFWDELDWIGVNFYFPLAANARALSTESAEISLAARKIAGIQSRYAKPILFTEVGFPALATAAARPWEGNSSALNPKLQARCYSVWLERFACQSGVEGMFWWKWPSHGRGSPFDPSHSPLGKPALGVLKNWYERL